MVLYNFQFVFKHFGEFYLDKADWNAYLHKDNINHLNKGWTDVIAEKFSEINSICALKFKNYWFKTEADPDTNPRGVVSSSS